MTSTPQQDFLFASVGQRPCINFSLTPHFLTLVSARAPPSWETLHGSQFLLGFEPRSTSSSSNEALLTSPASVDKLAFQTLTWVAFLCMSAFNGVLTSTAFPGAPGAGPKVAFVCLFLFLNLKYSELFFLEKNCVTMLCWLLRNDRATGRLHRYSCPCEPPCHARPTLIPEPLSRAPCAAWQLATSSLCYP